VAKKNGYFSYQELVVDNGRFLVALRQGGLSGCISNTARHAGQPQKGVAPQQ
jgi:hypothetical protein